MNHLTDHNSVIFVEYYTELLKPIDSVRSMMKKRQNNDVTDHTGPLYDKKEIELSWTIR